LIQEEPTMKSPGKSKDRIREVVRERYGRIASGGEGSCGCGPSSSCCGSVAPDALALNLGYSGDELKALPEGANLGLSCGNPAALASLKAGETVLDLGSGGGFDVFIAARKVGRSGRAIGVDMTPEMLARARRNAEGFRRKTGLDNAEFRLGEIEHLPAADSSVDVVISNCVINLSPDKLQVWREMARVLRPGGRVAVSDLALLKPLPPSVRESIDALVGCIAGAALVRDIERMARTAGFTDLRLEPKVGAIDAMVDGHDALYRTVLAALPRGATLADYVTSLSIAARKPDRRGVTRGR
jgi:SAM-dependent methyltransferase